VIGVLPNRLMTAFEVAEFIGCHEETVRRAYVDWEIITGLILERLKSPRRRPCRLRLGYLRRQDEVSQTYARIVPVFGRIG
jgi:hypothetical protein